MPWGEGFVGLSLVLPHRAALVASDPLALAPEQVMNRYVRGILEACELSGVPALYPGRDVITVQRRILALASFEVEASGALVFEAVIANGWDFSVLPGLLDRADPEGVVKAGMLTAEDTTSLARQPGGAGRCGGDGGRRVRRAGELHPRRRPRADGERDDRAGARDMTLADRLRAPDTEVCRAAIAELAERGRGTPEELAALADCLGAGRKAVERPAAEAFAALAARGVAVDEILRAALASPFARRRWGAAFALSLAGDPPAATLPVLLETLGAGDG